MRSRTLLRLPAILLLVTAPALRSAAQNPPVAVVVDIAASRRPISSLIYGVAHATAAQLQKLNVPLNRNGGNNTSRYNWQQNADNRGADWYFESIPDPLATPGERGDRFIALSRSNGAEPALTIPSIPWVAKVGPSREKLASFSILKYGLQTGADAQWFPDAGNGISSATLQPIAGNDPNDANIPSNPAFQRGWIDRLIAAWGTVAQGGLKYYTIDNEPSLWHETHRDVVPIGQTLAETRNRLLGYAAMIKDADPGALVLGPEEWGWTGYLYSGFDQQYGKQHGWSDLPDRAANGGWDAVPYLLDRARAESLLQGRRLLDVLTVHFYPQDGEFGSDVSEAMQLRRNRSTRALWDPNYVDETWINERVRLIPRLKEWVAAHYPETKTGLTEYNWGAEGHINGATAQADVLGIFGREGLDLAARWTTPAANTPAFKAIQLYRNYDGQRSVFGETSVLASHPNPDSLSAFAATRGTDGALTIMLVSKVLAGETPVNLQLLNSGHEGSAQVWQLTSANTIVRGPDLPLAAGAAAIAVPAQSVTLLVVPGDAGLYHFETGKQGWTKAGAIVTGVAQSSNRSYQGTRSLKVAIQAAGPAKGRALASGLLPPAGATAKFRVWIPLASKLKHIRPYVKDANGLMTGSAKTIGSLVAGSWNEISLTVPPSGPPVAEIGVEFATKQAWTGACYVDSVAW